MSEEFDPRDVHGFETRANHWFEAYTSLREDFNKLLYFYLMVDTGGPDGSDLDYLVVDEAAEVAAHYRSEALEGTTEEP